MSASSLSATGCAAGTSCGNLPAPPPRWSTTLRWCATPAAPWSIDVDAAAFGNNQGLKLPPELDLPVVEARAPYDAQIAELRRHVGAVFLRRSMKEQACARRTVMC